MPSSYFLYGLRVLADGDVPGFAPAPECETPDVRVYLGKVPSWFDSVAEIVRQGDLEKAQSPLTILEHNSEWWLLRYEDGTDFAIDQFGTEIWVRFRNDASLEDAATYLVGPVFAFLLRLRGTYCLHASSVAVGNSAIAITGSKGSGKSTTAAAFAKLGYRVLSDDLAPLAESGDGFLVHPGYPRLCLWPDAAGMLFGTLPRIVPLNGGSDWWDKRYLDLAAGDREFSSQPLPLDAVYILQERCNSPEAPHLELLPPPAALIAMVTNIYGARLLDRPARAAAFEILGRLVNGTPVFSVTPQMDPARLPQLCDLILQNVPAFTGSQ